MIRFILVAVMYLQHFSSSAQTANSFMTVEVLSTTSSSLTVKGTLSKNITSEVSQSAVFINGKQQGVCDNVYNGATCKVTQLEKCTMYNVKLQIKTTDKNVYEASVNVATLPVEPPKPSRVVSVSMDFLDKYTQKPPKKYAQKTSKTSSSSSSSSSPTYSSSSYFSASMIAVTWRGPKLNSSDEHYEYTYTKDKKEITRETKENQVLINPDEGSKVTVKVCNKCGCSEGAEAQKLNIPYLVKAIGGAAGFGLGDQIKKWNEMNDKRMKMWASGFGGMGAGFLIAFLIATAYFIKKRRDKRKSLLPKRNVTATYTNLTHDEAVQL